MVYITHAGARRISRAWTLSKVHCIAANQNGVEYTLSNLKGLPSSLVDRSAGAYRQDWYSYQFFYGACITCITVNKCLPLFDASRLETSNSVRVQ